MKKCILFLLILSMFFSQLLSQRREISKISPDDNLALNKNREGYTSILGSDRGWGGGNNLWEIVDGYRTYDEWAHGLAFCGGKKKWCNEECGWREILIDFGEVVSINRVVVWHHGLEHVSNIYKIQILDMKTGEYKTVFSTNRGKDYLKFQIINKPVNWWENFSTPTENVFKKVSTRRLRYVLNNCDIEHGWIYEIEVY